MERERDGKTERQKGGDRSRSRGRWRETFEPQILEGRDPVLPGKSPLELVKSLVIEGLHQFVVLLAEPKNVPHPPKGAVKQDLGLRQARLDQVDSLLVMFVCLLGLMSS